VNTAGSSDARDPFVRFLRCVTERWRAEAVMLRRRGAEAQAAAIESCGSDLEEEAQRFSYEGITLEEAANESGYSYSALQKMVSAGRVSNAGTSRRPLIYRRDLPRKPVRAPGPSSEPDLASLVLEGVGASPQL
jgi:hypothetical protein